MQQQTLEGIRYHLGAYIIIMPQQWRQRHRWALRNLTQSTVLPMRAGEPRYLPGGQGYGVFQCLPTGYQT